MTPDRVIVRSLRGAAYLLAASLVVVPLLDAALALWPARVADIGWRYGMVGIVTQDLTLPLVGLALAVGVALVFEHVPALRVVAVLSALGVTLLLIVFPLFVLDAVQMRSSLAEELSTAFDFATGTAVLKMLVIALFGTCVAAGGFAPRHPYGPAGRPPGSSRSIFVAGGRTRTRSPDR